MIPLPLLLLVQDVPAGDDAGEYEIVVSAVYGRTTMLFDKGADGKLRNCRVMVSSGSDRRDAQACQATPVCVAAATAEASECQPLVSVEPAVPPAQLGLGGPAVFDMPQLAMPKKPLAPGAAGPSAEAAENDENERQRVKLPPLPKPPSDGPVVTFGNGSKD